MYTITTISSSIEDLELDPLFEFLEEMMLQNVGNRSIRVGKTVGMRRVQKLYEKLFRGWYRNFLWTGVSRHEPHQPSLLIYYHSQFSIMIYGNI